MKGFKMGGENQVREILEPGAPGFRSIFRSFRMAIQPSKLIIALGALALISLVGWVMDLGRTVAVTPGSNGRETELQVYMADPQRVRSYIEKYDDDRGGAGVFSTLWHFSRNRFHGALRELLALNLPGVGDNVAECLRATQWAISHHPLYCIVFFLMKLAVISIAGGAICRIAALQFARGEKPDLTEALRFSLKRFTSFFAAPLVPAAMAILVAAFLVVLGLIGNIPRLGELIVGILMPLAMLAGAMIAVVLVGAIAGFNLMFPAVACDGSDSLDAVSRSFNYVCARPWRMLFYTATAAVYGAICYIFVRFFAFLLLWSTYRAVRLGMLTGSVRGLPDKIMAIWPEPTFQRLLAHSQAAGNWSESAAAFLIYLCGLVIVGLLVSFLISFYFSANTVIYALMRNKVDNTPLDDVYTETQPARTEPPGRP